MVQPDLGSVIVAGGITTAVLFAGGVRLAPLAGVAATGFVIASILAVAAPYRRARLLAFIDPWESPESIGYQNIQSLVGIAGGGVTGVGIGEGRVKWGYLPEADTDFIFAVVAEEMGLVGSLLVLALFVLIAVMGIRIALRAPDRFGTLVAIGIVVWLVTQAIVNIGAVIGVLPITGIPLPVRVSRRHLARGRHGRGGSVVAGRTSGPGMTEFVIAGGGTAGHVHPGLAVARALVERGHAIESVLYVGSDAWHRGRPGPERRVRARDPPGARDPASPRPRRRAGRREPRPRGRRRGRV